MAATWQTTQLPVREYPSAILFVLPSVLLAWERILVIYCQHGLYQVVPVGVRTMVMVMVCYVHVF
ncbi:hypothetical protein E2C01_076723 [Portunus trituberculatus]|uniref:Uncharacterized protein n=1 Tax=Portunus trituberculatus TaxID=210409 RepID=A0A5B7IJD8_PORTR|nr:hypothetical protein [Portunus trituberculatus]